MRVMISQPSKGTSAEERARVLDALGKEGHEVVGTITVKAVQEDAEQTLGELEKALQAISTVDAVYFMEGWDTDKGCRVGYEACVLFGKMPMNATVSYLSDQDKAASSIAQKAFPGLDELKTLEDYEAFFTTLMKECFPSLFWEYMKGRPIMQMVAAVIDEAAYTLKRAGKLDGRCEICGAVIGDDNCGIIYREQIQVNDAASGERFSIQGAAHLRCRKHTVPPYPSYVSQKEHLSFEDLTYLAWLDVYVKRKPAIKRYLIAAMKNCIAGLEKEENG